MALRVGIVPEHFSIPWHEMVRKDEGGGARVQLVEQPRGTGAMCKALRDNELDVAVALTEGVVSNLAEEGGRDAFCIEAAFTDSPLLWAVVAAGDAPLTAEEAEAAAAAAAASTTATTAKPRVTSLDELEGGTFAISRLGSGSHLMAHLLAERQRWAADKLRFVAEGGLEALVTAVRTGRAQAFLWEKTMLKTLVDAGRLRYVGEIATPWPCFVVAVRRDVAATRRADVAALLAAVQRECAVFQRDTDESVKQMHRRFGLSEDDSRAWLSTVAFSTTGRLARRNLQLVIDTLQRLGLLASKISVADLVSSTATVLEEPVAADP